MIAAISISVVSFLALIAIVCFFIRLRKIQKDNTGNLFDMQDQNEQIMLRLERLKKTNYSIGIIAWDGKVFRIGDFYAYIQNRSEIRRQVIEHLLTENYSSMIPRGNVVDVRRRLEKKGVKEMIEIEMKKEIDGINMMTKLFTPFDHSQVENITQ